MKSVRDMRKTESRRDAVSEVAVDGAAVESHQQFLLQMVPPQHPKEEKSLLGFLTTTLVLVVHERSSAMRVPRNLKEDTHRIQSPSMLREASFPLCLLKQSPISFVLMALSRKFVFSAPSCQFFNLLPVCGLIPSTDEANDCRVISKFNDGVGGVSGCTVINV